MRTLAKELGLSDVGLAKLCRRHEIPLPGRGYWARIQFGQKPERPALSVASNPALEAIEISPHEPSIPQEQPREPIPVIEVADDREITHAVARRIGASLSRSKKDERGLLLTRQGRVVPLKVSAESLSRSLRIVDVLFSALEEHKCSLEWAKPYNTSLNIISDGEKLRFSVTEIVERKQHNPTSEEIAQKKHRHWWNSPRWDYVLTGRLKIEIGSMEFYNIHNSWTDGKRRKLETCVGEIIIACETSAPAIKREREEQKKLNASEQKSGSVKPRRQSEEPNTSVRQMQSRNWQRRGMKASESEVSSLR